MPSPPLVIGLTGGIGSGKTAVADTFAAAGIPMTDTDALAHALTAPAALRASTATTARERFIGGLWPGVYPSSPRWNPGPRPGSNLV